MRSATITLIMGAALVLFLTGCETHCQQLIDSPRTLEIIEVVSSARANGMGGCTINLVDEESMQYNPGALGLVHLNKFLCLSIPIASTWAPNIGNDVRVKSYGFSAGASRKKSHSKVNPGFNISFAVAASHRVIYFHDTPYFPGDRTYQSINAYTFSVGFEKVIRVGMGYTYNSFTFNSAPLYSYTSSHSEGSMEEAGMLVEVPLVEVFRGKQNRDDQTLAPRFELTPSYAYVSETHGKDKQDGLIYGITREGISIYAAYLEGDIKLLSLRLSRELQIQQANDFRTTSYGAEIGGYGILFLRIGKFSDQDSDNYGRDITTYGFGLELNGLLKKVVGESNGAAGDDEVTQLLRNSNLSFNIAWYKGGIDQLLDNTKFMTLNLSF